MDTKIELERRRQLFVYEQKGVQQYSYSYLVALSYVLFPANYEATLPYTLNLATSINTIKKECQNENDFNSILIAVINSLESKYIFLDKEPKNFHCNIPKAMRNIVLAELIELNFADINFGAFQLLQEAEEILSQDAYFISSSLLKLLPEHYHLYKDQIAILSSKQHKEEYYIREFEKFMKQTQKEKKDHRTINLLKTELAKKSSNDYQNNSIYTAMSNFVTASQAIEYNSIDDYDFIKNNYINGLAALLNCSNTKKFLKIINIADSSLQKDIQSQYTPAPIKEIKISLRLLTQLTKIYKLNRIKKTKQSSIKKIPHGMQYMIKNSSFDSKTKTFMLHCLPENVNHYCSKCNASYWSYTHSTGGDPVLHNVSNIGDKLFSL